MQEVNLYVSSSNKSPKILNGKCFYRLETQTSKGMVGLENEFAVIAPIHQAELLAINAALKRVIKPCLIVIHTDSEYVETTLRENRLEKWCKSGWVNAKGNPVANREEWQELMRLLADKPFKVILERMKNE